MIITQILYINNYVWDLLKITPEIKIRRNRKKIYIYIYLSVNLDDVSKN